MAILVSLISLVFLLITIAAVRQVICMIIVDKSIVQYLCQILVLIIKFTNGRIYIFRRIWLTFKGVILMNMTFSVVFANLFYLIGARVTSISVLCGVVSGFLQFFVLVLTCSTLTPLLEIYLSLTGLSQKLRRRCLLSAIFISWCKLFV